MRTANEWYRKINSYSNPDTMNDVEREWVEKMINAARQETIEECANAAILNYKGNGHPTITVDKESILNLIKELK